MPERTASAICLLLTMVMPLLLVMGCAARPADLPPAHWRLPAAGELAGHSFRDASPTRFVHASADLDGDGKIDEARLFMRTDGTGEGLFVRRGGRNRADWTPLAQWQHGAGRAQMGVAILAPGPLRTACGKGYWPCAEGEPEALMLTRPTLRYFLPESAASIFVWRPDAGDFERIWISD